MVQNPKNKTQTFVTNLVIRFLVLKFICHLEFVIWIFLKSS
jgi:hypothetical protein